MDKKRLTTMRIPQDLYERLEQIAEKERKNTGKNVSITQLVINALAIFVALRERSDPEWK